MAKKIDDAILDELLRGCERPAWPLEGNPPRGRAGARRRSFGRRSAGTCDLDPDRGARGRRLRAHRRDPRHLPSRGTAVPSTPCDALRGTDPGDPAASAFAAARRKDERAGIMRSGGRSCTCRACWPETRRPTVLAPEVWGQIARSSPASLGLASSTWTTYRAAAARALCRHAASPAELPANPTVRNRQSPHMI